MKSDFMDAARRRVEKEVVRLPYGDGTSHPWRLYHKGARVIGMVDGKLDTFSTAAPGGAVLTVTMADETVADDATHKFYVELPYAIADFYWGNKVFEIGTPAVDNGASVPAATLTMVPPADGSLFVEIGTVAVAAGVVTITQALDRVLPLLLTAFCWFAPDPPEEACAGGGKPTLRLVGDPAAPTWECPTIVDCEEP